MSSGTGGGDPGGGTGGAGVPADLEGFGLGCLPGLGGFAGLGGFEPLLLPPPLAFFGLFPPCSPPDLLGMMIQSQVIQY